MKARNALASRLRGLLAEFGIVVPQGISHVYKLVPEALEDASNELPGFLRVALQAGYDHLKLQEQHLQSMASMIQRWHRKCPASRAIERIPGIGVLSASALVASMGEASSFGNGRQVSAWTGIVPKQHLHGPPRRASFRRCEGLNGLQPYIRAVCAGVLLPIMAMRSQGSHLHLVLHLVLEVRAVCRSVPNSV
jgi:transposase